MTEPNYPPQWQARPQWPQKEAWEVPAGHQKQLPHWEVVQHRHRLPRGAGVASVSGFRDLVRQGHRWPDPLVLVRALLRELCRFTGPPSNSVISWAPPRSIHRDQQGSLQPQYQILCSVDSQFQYYTKGVRTVALHNFPNRRSSSRSLAGVTAELPSSQLHSLEPFRRYSSISDVQPYRPAQATREGCYSSPPNTLRPAAGPALVTPLPQV